MAYDPVKAHEYYVRTRELKGRKAGSKSSLIGDGGRPVAASSGGRRPPKSQLSSQANQAQRVKRLKTKVDTIQGALSKAQAALVKARQSARKTARENSDGKSTTEEKRASKEYRDKNSAKIDAKGKREGSSTSSGGSSSSGSSSASSSSSNSVDSMSVEDLESRIIKLRSTLSEAKRQLANASQSLGHMAHSAILSDPEVNDQFARYRSVERKPSK